MSAEEGSREGSVRLREARLFLPCSWEGSNEAWGLTLARQGPLRVLNLFENSPDVMRTVISSPKRQS